MKTNRVHIIGPKTTGPSPDAPRIPDRSTLRVLPFAAEFVTAPCGMLVPPRACCGVCEACARTLPRGRA